MRKFKLHDWQKPNWILRISSLVKNRVRTLPAKIKSRESRGDLCRQSAHFLYLMRLEPSSNLGGFCNFVGYAMFNIVSNLKQKQKMFGKLRTDLRFRLVRLRTNIGLIYIGITGIYQILLQKKQVNINIKISLEILLINKLNTQIG